MRFGYEPLPSATSAWISTSNGRLPSHATELARSGDTFLVNGSANIRELNRSQNWELPTDGPKTLNGLILELLETIPDAKTCMKINGYPIEIIESDGKRIRSVRIAARIENRQPKARTPRPTRL